MRKRQLNWLSILAINPDRDDAWLRWGALVSDGKSATGSLRVAQTGLRIGAVFDL
jgi:hypothetical protein